MLLALLTVFAAAIFVACTPTETENKIIVHRLDGEPDIELNKGDKEPTLTRVGYYFDGFYTEETLENSIKFTSIDFSKKSVWHLYVKWTECTHRNCTWEVAREVGCTTDGEENYVCATCGKITNTKTIPAGHDVKKHYAQSPTCTDDGWEAYETCKREGCTYSTYVAIPALGHDLESHEAIEPNCEHVGCDAYETCKRVGCTYSTYVEKPIAHTFGDDGVCTKCGWFVSGLELTLNSDGLGYSVTGIGSFTGTDLVIPAVGPDAKPVVGIKNLNLKNVVSVTLPSSIKSVEKYAIGNAASLKNVYVSDLAKFCMIEFGSSDNLLKGDVTLYVNGEPITDLTVPETVTRIGSYAFYGSNTIKSLTITDGVRVIGEEAFKYSALEAVEIADCLIGIEEEAFGGTPWLSAEYAKAKAELGAKYVYVGKVLYSCISSSDIKGVITLPEVNGIAANAFSGCTLMSKIELNNRLKYIGSKAFYGCEATVTGLTGNSELEYIGDDAFNNKDKENTRLTSFTFGSWITYIGDNAFKNCALSGTLTLPYRLEYLGKNAFEGCKNLTSVVVNENLKQIGEYAFKDCTELTTVEWNAIDCTLNADSNWHGPFAGCEDVSKIRIGTKVESLPSALFSYLTGLKSVTIPANVKKIGANLFKGSSKLELVEFKGTSAEWLTAVEGATDWHSGTKIYYVDCSDGKCYGT